MFHKKSRKYKAWLVTWEWIGDHAKRDDKIVAVLDPRWRPDHVREFVELFFISTSRTASANGCTARCIVAKILIKRSTLTQRHDGLQ